MRAAVQRASDPCRDGAEPHHATTQAGTPSSDPARYLLAAVRSALAQRARSPVEAAVRDLATRVLDPARAEAVHEAAHDENAPDAAQARASTDRQALRARPAIDPAAKPSADLPDDDARIDRKGEDEGPAARIAAARGPIADVRAELAHDHRVRSPDTWLLTAALAELLGIPFDGRIAGAAGDVDLPFPQRPLDRDAAHRQEESPPSLVEARRRAAGDRGAEGHEARQARSSAQQMAERSAAQHRALAKGPVKDKPKAPPKDDKTATPSAKGAPPSPSRPPKPGPEDTVAVVRPPTGGDAGGGAAVAAWKARLDANVGNVNVPPVPDADRYVVTYRAAAKSTPRQTDERKRQLIAEAKKAVTPVEQYQDDDLKLPDDPLPDARVAVDKWVNQRIRKQDLPTLQPSPLGSMPELGTSVYADKEGNKHVIRELSPGKYAEIHVLAPGERPPAVQLGGEVRQEKKLDGKGTLAERLKAHNLKEPRNLKPPAAKSLGAKYNDDLPLRAPVLPPLQGIAKIDTAKVLEAALSGMDKHAGKILQQTVDTFPGGKGIPDGYTDEWRAEVRSDVVAELEKIHAVGQIGGKGLEDKLKAERDKVEIEVKAAHDQVKEAKKESGAGHRTVYEAVGNEILGLRDELDRQIDDQTAIAKGGTDAKEIIAKRDLFIKANTDKVETWLGRYEKMREARKKQLTDSHQQQTLAYKACAELDRKQLVAQAGADKDKDPVKTELAAGLKTIDDWEIDVIQGAKGIDKKFEALQGEVDVDVDKYTAILKTTGEAYEEACKEWARIRLGLERGFWAKLLNAILEWFGLAKKEAKVWQVRSEEDNSAHLAEDELWLNEFQLQHHGELTKASLKEMAGLSDAQRAIAQSFFIDKKGDGAAALAAGLIARLGDQWKPRLHRRIEQKVLKDSCPVVVAVADATRGFRTMNKVSELNAAFVGAGTKREDVFKALAGLSPIQARAVELLYEVKVGVPLRDDISSELNDIVDVVFYGSHDEDRALALLEGGKSHADILDKSKLDEGAMDAAAVALDQAMEGTFLHGAGTGEKDLLELLRGKSPREIEAIKRAYFARYKRDLADTIREELLDDVSAPHQWQEALAWLEGSADDAEAAAMRSSMGHVRTQGPRSHLFFGLDDDAVINWYTRDHKEAEASFARIREQVALDADKYGWTEETYKRQLGVRLGQLDAAFGTNYGGEFNAFDPTKSALDVAFGQAFSPDQAKLLTGIRTQDLALESAARVSIEHKGVLPDTAEVNRALADQYTRQYAAERRDVEHEWREKKEKEWADCTVKLLDKNGKVVKDAQGNDKIDAEKTKQKQRDWGKRWLDPIAAHERKKEADAEAERRAQDKAPENMRRLKKMYEDPSNGFVSGSIFSQGSFEGDVYSATNAGWAGFKDMIGYEARTADTDKTMALLARDEKGDFVGGYLTGGQKLFFSVYGQGTDVAGLHNAYAGKSRAEIEKMHADLRGRMDKVGVDESWTAEAWIKDDLSGRELDDVTVEMELGEAVTLEQKIARAERRRDLEKASRQKGAGDTLLGSILFGPIAGPMAAAGFAELRSGMASTEMAILDDEVAALRAEIALMERDKAELAERGIVEGDAEYYQVITERYERVALVAEGVDAAVASHRAQVDAIADWATSVIQVAMIGGAIAIGAVVSAVTGGTATPAVVAAWTALITAMTTSALTIATKAIVKGGAYGWEEVANDIAMAVVDGIMAYATANVGSTLLKGALLSKLAKGNIVARLAAHGAANTVEGVIQALPSSLFGALLYDNPDLFGILTQIGTSAGMAFGMGLKGGVAPHPGAVKPGARGRPTNDILAYRGTPQDRINAFKAYRKLNPGADLKTWLHEMDSRLLARHKTAFDDASTQRALRKDLLEGLPVPQRKQLAGARIEMLSDADFPRVFGDTEAPARLIAREGSRPVLAVRAGTDLGALGREAPRLFAQPAEAGAPRRAAKPAAVEGSTPRPRGASASPDPRAPEPRSAIAEGPHKAAAPPPKRIIVEPYSGPKLDSPIDLAVRNPDARVIATEASIKPDEAQIAKLQKAGGTFIGENKTPHLPVGSVDEIKMRFPIPTERTIEQDFHLRLAEVERLHPEMDRIAQYDMASRLTEHLAESLTAYGPYALERLKPGGSLEVVYHEQSILGEVADVSRLRFIDPATGKGYRLELVEFEIRTRGEVAPYSGYGIDEMTHATEVRVTRFEKVELKSKLPRGAQGPEIAGEVVGQHSRRPFFPDRAGGPIRDLDYSKIRFTDKGVEAVEAHVRRFEGGGEMELAMVDRLRRIARGEIPATDFDRAFYSHELRESVRYRRLGMRTGQPLDADEAYRVWNDTHTATLEDYKLREKLPGGKRALFHPEVVERFDPSVTGGRGPAPGEVSVAAPGARKMLAPGESLEPRIRRSIERELRSAGHPAERVRGLSDEELLARHAEVQVKQAPKRIAEYRSTLDPVAQGKLDALQAATHLHHQPISGALEPRIGEALGTKVRVLDELPQGEVRVHYKVGALGNVHGIELHVGPGATLGDVLGHIPALAAYKRYQGLTGVVRRVIDAVESLLRGGARLPVGSRAHEAWLEVQKLPGIIESRRVRLADRALDATARVRIEAEIQALERQLARHVGELGDLRAGRRYVAVEGPDEKGGPSKGEAPASDGSTSNEFDALLEDLEAVLEGFEAATKVQAVDVEDAIDPEDEMRKVMADAVSNMFARQVTAETRAAADAFQQRLRPNFERIEQARRNPELLSPDQRAALAQAEAEINTMRASPSNTLEADENALDRWRTAARQVRYWADAGEPLTLKRISDIHDILTGSTKQAMAEPWRKEDVGVGDRSYMPFNFVHREMNDFFQWYEANRGQMNPIQLAAESYQRLVSIHPFIDVNGRTTRLVMDYILLSNGIPEGAFEPPKHNVAVFPNEAFSRPHKVLTPDTVTERLMIAIERVVKVMPESIRGEIEAKK